MGGVDSCRGTLLFLWDRRLSRDSVWASARRCNMARESSATATASRFDACRRAALGRSRWRASTLRGHGHPASSLDLTVGAQQFHAGTEKLDWSLVSGATAALVDFSHAHEVSRYTLQRRRALDPFIPAAQLFRAPPGLCRRFRTHQDEGIACGTTPTPKRPDDVQLEMKARRVPGHGSMKGQAAIHCSARV